MLLRFLCIERDSEYHIEDLMAWSPDTGYGVLCRCASREAAEYTAWLLNVADLHHRPLPELSLAKGDYLNVVPVAG